MAAGFASVAWGTRTGAHNHFAPSPVGKNNHQGKWARRVRNRGSLRFSYCVPLDKVPTSRFEGAPQDVIPLFVVGLQGVGL